MRVSFPMVSRPVRYAGVAVVAGVIFVTSLIDPPAMGSDPVPYGPFGIVLLDKWIHALAYMALAGVLLYASAGAHLRTLAVAVALTVCYGLGIEITQAFLSERSFDLADLAANAVGAVAAAAGWRTTLLYVRLVPMSRKERGRHPPLYPWSLPPPRNAGIKTLGRLSVGNEHRRAQSRGLRTR